MRSILSRNGVSGNPGAVQGGIRMVVGVDQYKHIRKMAAEEGLSQREIVRWLGMFFASPFSPVGCAEVFLDCLRCQFTPRFPQAEFEDTFHRNQKPHAVVAGLK